MTSERAAGREQPGPEYHDATITYDVESYERLLKGLLTAGYSFVGFDEPIGDREIALRHDVDLSMERAVAMARLEAELGVSSTYCLLVSAPAYDLLDPETRRRAQTILAAGHDLALHFDPHYYWDERPSRNDLVARVEADRAALERALEAETTAVSIHMPPDWALGASFDRFQSTYAPEFFDDVAYRADSSQRWRETHPFEEGAPDSMQLLVHPGLWYPTERSMSDIVDEQLERGQRRVEAYYDPLGA